MPDVRMPDGTIVRNVPEGTTRAQLMARLGKAKPRNSGTGIGWLDQGLSSLNEAIIGIPEGIYNAAAAVTDPAAEFIMNKINGDDSGTRAVSSARRQRANVVDKVSRAVSSKPAPIARTAGQIGGSLAIPLPGKKLQEGGKLARGAYRAMQGAVGGAAVRNVDDESAADEAAIGAGVNVALPPILRLLANTPPGRAVGNALGRLARPIVEAIEGPAPAIPANPRPLAPLGRKAEARAARLKSVGVRQPTTGMVTRDPNSFAFERNTAPIQGVGEDLQRQIQDVEQALVEKGREIVRAQGGSKGAEATGAEVQKALDAKRGEMQAVTGRLYDAVRDERGDEIVGALDSLNDLMTSPDITDNATFDSMRESLARRMGRLGIGADKTRLSVDDLTLKPVTEKAPEVGPGRFQPVEAPDEFSALGVRRAGRTSVRGPLDLTQQLRAWGGIRDQGGELAHLGIGNTPRKLDFGSNEQFLGRLVNDEGMTLDEATERLWEAGYFNPHGPRPTPDDLLTRLRQEAMGERSFLPDDLDEVARFQGLRADRLKMQEAADNGAPFAEDVSQPAVPPRAPLSAQEEEAARTPRGVSVRQAEELRKFIGTLGNTADPAVRMMRRNLIDALDDDVVNSIGGDAFKTARASAKARFDEFKKTFAGRIADEGIPAERLTKRVLSDTTSLADLRALKQSLTSGTDEQIARGKEALQSLRGQAIDDFLRKSMNEEGKVLGGQLAREFGKQSAKFRELLEPADYKELRRLVLASRDATVAPPGSAVNYSGTAPALANMFQSTKPAVKESWLKFIAKHTLAGAVSFPAGNVVAEVGTRAVASAAQQRAAQTLMRRVELARNPEATAKAIEALQKASKTNPAAKGLLDQLGPAIGGASAGAAQ